jgi:hypothetical protein
MTLGSNRTTMTDRERAVTPPADPTLPRRYAELLIDALANAGLVRRDDFDEAVRRAATEIRVRQELAER